MRIGVNARFLAARVTGVQRFARAVTRELCGRGEVVLLVPASAPLPDEGWGWSRVERGRLDGPLWEQLELPRAARRADLDVLLHPANASRAWSGPSVVVLHDILPLTHPDGYALPYRLWVRWSHVRGARRAERVVTVSRWSAGQLRDRLGIPEERLGVVRQGLAPMDRPAGPGEVEAVRARLGLREPYLLAVAGDRRRGAELLLRLQAEWPDAPPLCLVGGGYRGVHRQAAAAGREGVGGGAVRRLGHVSDETLRALYTGALAFLHPSRAEGFGRPPLEALACGTRVVVAGYGAAREVLGDRVDYAARHPSAWREAVEAVLEEDGDERARRVAAGQAHAGTFTWSRAAGELLAILEEAVDGAAGTGSAAGRLPTPGGTP